MEVKVLRMNTGEEVIYTQVNETDDYVEVENALVALPNAQGQIGFSPWSYLSDEGQTIKISKDYIVYVIEAREMVVDNYKKIFSKIETPSKKLIL
jgi:hypothetical protein